MLHYICRVGGSCSPLLVNLSDHRELVQLRPPAPKRCSSLQLPYSGAMAIEPDEGTEGQHSLTVGMRMYNLLIGSIGGRTSDAVFPPPDISDGDRWRPEKFVEIFAGY